MPVHPRIPEQVPEPVALDRLELGEGARLLADGSVVIVDILSGRLLRVPDGGGPLVELARLDEPLGAVAPVAGRPGHWLAAAGTGFATFAAGSPDGGGRRPGTRPEWIARPAGGPGPRRRMNDAVCDPSGRMWAGSMAYDATEGAGSLYRLDRDGTVTEVVDGLTVPNGPAFDATGTRMYLADTARGIIDVFDVDPVTGDLGERRPFARVPTEDGQPDGMVVDARGRLWCALWGGGEVRCFGPDGGVVDSVALPAVQPTSVCLAEGRMLVTSAAYGLASPGPQDGAVLQVPGSVEPVITPMAVLD